MANLKELFKSFRAQKAYVSKSLNDLDPGVESADFTDATLALEAQTVPYIDYSNPENFVFYGSAEQYYQDAFNYIRQEYPYDGSGKEKADWERLASGFDKYIYESVYPRVNGYVTLGKDITIGSSTVDGYWQPSRTEYIYFEGGPHPAPQIAQGDPLTSFFPSSKGATPGSNYYNEELNQQSNLEIDGERGITLEFWLRKDGYIPALESPRQIICDIWNNETWGDTDYGRFRVELSASAGEMLPNFRIELLSGSTGFTSGQVSDTNTTLILSASSVTGSWNHFALTFQNDTTQMVGKLYQNGNLVDSLITGSTMGLVAGALVGQLGSLVTNVSGTQGARGNALLSGSFDELRFWKTARSSQQIGMNWFTQINGGTNSDFQDEINATTKYSFTNPVDLGFYYKFNEGITGIAATDSIVLDYSGRITNGSWVGYGDVPDQRSLASAMVEASASAFEYKDPILYSYNPSVSTTLNGLLQTGFNYDINNNASIYQSLPGWIRDDDAVNDRQILLKLTQVISSYFDRLQLQIQRLPRLKDINYISSSFKPLPFVDRMIDSTGLTSAELFSEAKAFEKLVSRDDFRLFSEKLDNTKNRIYQNIYNNLVYIFKSKGAEKAFRSLIRCYGVGDELIKFSLYADEVTYTIKENFESTVTKKRFADFYTLTNFTASVYQSTGAIANPDERSFLSSSVSSSFQGNTFETEIFFPKSDATTKAVATYVAFQTSSLFGLHTADPSTPNDTTWFTPDVGNFQVYAIKTGWQNKDAVFMLTGTAGGSFPLLTSSIQNDVYNNKKWNLAVRIKPTKYPWSAAIQGSEETTYDVEFLGYDTTLDVSENEFKVTGTISLADGQSFLTSSKRAYVGAHRTNFTGTVVLERSDVRIGSVRYWLDYLDDKTIFAHSKDSSNFGRYSPGRNTFLNQFGNNFGSEVTPIPEIETLALQWGFDQVTGSDASGEFFISDFSSGSVASTSSYGWLGPLVELQHPGKGIGFERSNSDVTLPEYIYTAKQQPPETLNSSDMVNIKTISDEEVFTTESRPIRYFFAVEKSMNAIITSEMIKLFATVLDFNNLIGEPVNRYRQDYKAIEKMRELFFRRVKNEAMDFEKFVDYFKWLDDTIVMLISQLFPVSANFSDSIFTMVESHVLERNKYWNKFPTLDLKLGDPEVGLYGINEMLYPYRRGSAPIPLSQSVHCVWAHARAESETFSSGDSTIDEERNIFREANDFRPLAQPATLTDISGLAPVQYEGSTFALRNFTKIYRFKADEMPVIHGGSNVVRIKNVQYAHAELPFGTSTQLKVNVSEIESDIDCDDVVDPNDKVKLRYKLTNNPIGYASGRGDIFAPWSLYSSSVDSGYAAQLAANFRPNTDITNYHDDFYGDDKETPMQGPFTEKYVGGWEYRHVPFTAPSGSRSEAWNLNMQADFSNAKSFEWTSPIGPTTAKVIEISDTSALRSRNGSWTVSLWFKNTWAGGTFLSRINEIGAWPSAGADWQLLIHGSGQIWFAIFDDSGLGYTQMLSANPYLTDGDWHLMVFGYDESANEIWADIDNGTWTDAVSLGAGIPQGGLVGNCKIGIGCTWNGGVPDWAPSSRFRGTMDEVGIWGNKTLNASEISEIWNTGCPTSLKASSMASSLVSWYRMGDLPGDNSTPITGRIGDVMGVNNGTPYNTDDDEIVEDVTGSSCGSMPGFLVLSPRTANQPRSTILREPLAKRPVNIRNIRMTTGSTIIGNYSHDYEIVQTSGRLTNNSFFIKNGGFDPEVSNPLLNVLGIADFTLPDFSKFGSNKWCFVEKFNAPGGPEVSSRGALDLYAEEYGVYNNLNVRNLVVRNALQKWQTSYNGQFGIDSSRQLTVSGSPPTIIGPGEPEGFRQPRVENYNTLASYHKVNRNGAHRGLYKENWSREVEWVELVGCFLSNFNRDLDPDLSLTFGFASSNQIIETTGYFEIEVALTEDWAAGISTEFLINDQTYLSLQSNQSIEYAFVCDALGNVLILESGTIPGGSPTTAIVVGDRLRIFRDKSTIVYQHKPLAGSGWVDLYTSLVVPSGNYYPRAILEVEGKITNARISNPRYDNWFIQHSIPQDRLQYAWINKSYDKSVDQPFGHLGSGDDGRTNFSVPFGNPTSLDSPQVQFLTAWTASLAYPPFFDPNLPCGPCSSSFNEKSVKWPIAPAGPAVQPSEYIILTENGVEIPGPFGAIGAACGDVFSSFGISVWVKIEQLSTTPMVIVSRGKWDGGSDVVGEVDWELVGVDVAGTNNVVFNVFDANGNIWKTVANTIVDIADGEWHHIAAGLRSQATTNCLWSMSLWIDNNLASGPIANTGLAREVTSDSKVTVGAHYDISGVGSTHRQWSEGYIDELAIFRTELSLAEVSALYNNGCPDTPVDHTDFISWYRMGDASGDSVANLGTINDVRGVNNGIASATSLGDNLEIVEDVPNPCANNFTEPCTSPFLQDFVGINSLIYDPIVSSENLLSSSDGNYENKDFGYMCPRVNPAVDELHALLLHRDGPYGYPSWKQIRTGETPVARYQKRNNIITVGPAQFDKPGPSIKKQELLTQIRMGGRWIADENRREQNLPTFSVNNWATRNPRLSFVEPMVTFKYRSLETRFLSGWTFYDPALAGLLATSSVQHTFCNNLYYFANAELSKEVGIQWTQGYDPSFTPNDRRPKQMHDVLYELPSLYNRLKSLIYSEVIYPKEIYTGLNIIRSRVNYTEDAPLSGTFAVADYGDNGIDRDSSRRRSFWSDEWF